jgi:polar amino acid transport system substrate-binding protein
MHWHTRFTPKLALVLGLLLPLAGEAACSRVINVPVAAIGQSVIIDGDSIKGIYPDLLRTFAEKEGCTVALTSVPRAPGSAV